MSGEWKLHGTIARPTCSTAYAGRAEVVAGEPSLPDGVSLRAKLTAARGRRCIEVDASDDSRPILDRLGFVAVTTTTPYVWSPSPATDS